MQSAKFQPRLCDPLIDFKSGDQEHLRLGEHAQSGSARGRLMYVRKNNANHAQYEWSLLTSDPRSWVDRVLPGDAVVVCPSSSSLCLYLSFHSSNSSSKCILVRRSLPSIR